MESRRVSSLPVTHVGKFDLAGEVIKQIGAAQKVATFDAINAALTSTSFEKGMEAEARLLAEISKPSLVKGTQYFYFNTRRFVNFYLHRTNYIISKKAVTFLDTTQAPTIYPTELQDILPRNFSKACIVGGSDEAIMIAKLYITSGVDCILLVVSALSTNLSHHYLILITYHDY